MTPAPTEPTLRALATNLLSERVLALEPATKDRVTLLLQMFAAGAISTTDLRAALGGPASGPSGAAPRSVAVIPLTGLLEPSDGLFSFLGLGTNVRGFIRQLNAAAAMRSITAIVALVDSPGGMIGMVPEAARAMRQARATKPVIAAVSGTAASAAYWIAANATKVRATQSGRVGAIGVFAQRVSLARALAEKGIDVTTISAGKFKAEGLPETPMTDVERQALQASVDEAYDQFVNDVALGRHVPASAVRSGFAEGRVVSARQAFFDGMIDDIQDVEVTIARAGEAATPNDIRTRAAVAVEFALNGLDMPTGATSRNPRADRNLDRLWLEIQMLGL